MARTMELRMKKKELKKNTLLIFHIYQTWLSERKVEMGHKREKDNIIESQIFL